MKKKIADRWVRALRSGKFQQCSGRLENEAGQNCCLGVLANLAVQSGVCPKDRLAFGKCGNTGTLPKEVMEWSGMHTEDGSRINRKSLVEYNDNLRWSFETIANVIEKNYKEL